MSIPATREQQREREKSQREREANAAQGRLSALHQQCTFEPLQYTPPPLSQVNSYSSDPEPSEDEQVDDETSLSIQNIFGNFSEFSKKMQSTMPVPIMGVINNNNNSAAPPNPNHKKKMNQIFVDMENKQKLHSTQKSMLPDLDSDLAAAVKHSQQHSTLKQQRNGLSTSIATQQVSAAAVSQPPPPQHPPTQPSQHSTLLAPKAAISSPSLIASMQDTHTNSNNNRLHKTSDYSDIQSNSRTKESQPAPAPPPTVPHLNGSIKVSNSNPNSNSAVEEFEENKNRNKQQQPTPNLLGAFKASVFNGNSSSNNSNSSHTRQLQPSLLPAQPPSNSTAVNLHSTNSNESSNLKPTPSQQKTVSKSALSESSDSDSSSSSEDESDSSDSDSSDASDSDSERRKKPQPKQEVAPVKKEPIIPVHNSLEWDLENFIDVDRKPSISNELDLSNAASSATKPYSSSRSVEPSLSTKVSTSKKGQQSSKRASSKQNYKSSAAPPPPAPSPVVTSIAARNDMEEGEVEEKPVIKLKLDLEPEYHESRSRKDLQKPEETKPPPLLAPTTSTTAPVSSRAQELSASKKGSSRSTYPQQTMPSSMFDESTFFNTSDGERKKEDKSKSSSKENDEPRVVPGRDGSVSSSSRRKLDSQFVVDSPQSNKTKSSSRGSDANSKQNTTIPTTTTTNNNHSSGKDVSSNDRKSKRRMSFSEEEAEPLPNISSKKSSKNSSHILKETIKSVPSPKDASKKLKMSDSDNKKVFPEQDNQQDKYVVSFEISKLKRLPDSIKRKLDDEQRTKQRQASPVSREIKKEKDKEKSSKNRDSEKSKSKIVDLPLQESKSTPPKKSALHSSVSQKKETKEIPLDFGNVRTPPTVTQSSSSLKKTSPLARTAPSASRNNVTPMQRCQSSQAQTYLRATMKVRDLFERNLSDSEAMNRARSVKRLADSQTDPVKQLAGHLESVIFFMTACIAFERKGLDDSSLRLVEETIKYIDQAAMSNRSTKSRYTQAIDPLADRKVTIITYRVKGMLNYRLYRLKEKSHTDYRETIQNINSDPNIKSIISRNVNAGGVIIDQSLLVPVKNALVAYEGLLTQNLVCMRAHEQWNKADSFIYSDSEYREFFDALNSRFQHFSILMPFEEFANWTLNALKNIYVSSQAVSSES